MFGKIDTYNTRKNRGQVQKLYLIEMLDKNTDLPLCREFVVMGSTGNVYNVNISNEPKCNCPDYVRRKCRCKHIYFILMRIMKVSQDMEDREKYTNEELTNMIACGDNNVPNVGDNLVIGENFKKVYSRKKNPDLLKKSKDDLCPICIDDLENGEDIDFCKGSCGKYVHVECFQMWCKSKGVKTCVFCRAEWITSTDYLNLMNY